MSAYYPQTNELGHVLANDTCDSIPSCLHYQQNTRGGNVGIVFLQEGRRRYQFLFVSFTMYRLYPGASNKQRLEREKIWIMQQPAYCGSVPARNVVVAVWVSPVVE